ncbi:MAG: pilus assembly protein N-terminal domain-containing protein [Hyphomicrobiaceae bacterium]
MLRIMTQSNPTASARNAASMLVLAVTGAACVAVPSATADDLIVRYDQAQLLRLPRPVNEIIIGNPSIADVAIQGGNLLVVTGKTFGVTNIIALDADRNIIQDQRIVVERDQAVVNLHRGTGRQTYSCTPQCQPNLTIGDDATYFKNLDAQSSSKVRFSESGSEPQKDGQ